MIFTLISFYVLGEADFVKPSPTQLLNQLSKYCTVIIHFDRLVEYKCLELFVQILHFDRSFLSSWREELLGVIYYHF